MPKDVSTLPFLNGLIGLGVTLALLYWAKAVLIPVALALLLTFLLTPIVTTLWHWGLHRVLAAALAAELPTYTGNLKQKIAQVRHAGTGGVLGKIQEAVQDVSTAVQQGTPA